MYSRFRRYKTCILEITSCKYKNNIGRHKMKISNKDFPYDNAAKIHPNVCNCSNFHFYGRCKHCG